MLRQIENAARRRSERWISGISVLGCERSSCRARSLPRVRQCFSVLASEKWTFSKQASGVYKSLESRLSFTVFKQTFFTKRWHEARSEGSSFDEGPIVTSEPPSFHMSAWHRRGFWKRRRSKSEDFIPFSLQLFCYVIFRQVCVKIRWHGEGKWAHIFCRLVGLMPRHLSPDLSHNQWANNTFSQVIQDWIYRTQLSCFWLQIIWS